MSTAKKTAPQRYEFSPPAIASRIRKILEDTGWSERELGRRADLPTGNHVNTLLRRLEAGNDAYAGTLFRIAVASGRSLEWLVAGVGSPERDAR